MPGLKRHYPDITFSANKVSPDEVDRYEIYPIIHPTDSLTWIGTCAGGTSAQAKALVLINKLADYPRNLAVSVVGTNDVGGSMTVNGKDQFGVSISETIGAGTAAKGTPAFVAYGTKIFSEVTSGTFTFAAGSAGSGSAQLGFGSVGTSTYFGLPTKIASTADVKGINYSLGGTQTTFNGGTIGAYVSTSVHAIQPIADVKPDQVYVVTFKPTYDAANENVMANR